MVKQITPLSCFIVTLITRIFDTLMFRFTMLDRIRVHTLYTLFSKITLKVADISYLILGSIDGYMPK